MRLKSPVSSNRPLPKPIGGMQFLGASRSCTATYTTVCEEEYRHIPKLPAANTFRKRSANRYFLFLVLWLHGCGIFTFSGVSVSPDMKDFSIQFYTEVSDGPPDMQNKLMDELATRIMRSTSSLAQAEKDGDIQYEGVIKSFSYRTTFSTKDEDDNPKEVQRLTITIEVSYSNPADEEASFKKKLFSASADMLSTENQLDKEPELIKEIFRQLVDDVYNKSIDNW
ncbi:LPS assembly lipoprotein LptE [Cardinium endosymbiont of Philonthus spinipes]|uniref:LPS assembly lipoprotein LptE n=1 Tax=Cardinium endosymbiont of Philonthus spinipes TaxID=3077941 RepID=UPI00313BB223